MSRKFIDPVRPGLAAGVFILAGISSLANGSPDPAGENPSQERPNVVFIMSDNHGAWQLGCYGNPDIYSPNIDKLATGGTRFTSAMSCNPVCSPTRASVLTGLMPSQHGVHHWLLNGTLQTGPDAQCTIAEFTTLPEALSEAGYYCGLVGKWHLGDNLNPQEGFDYWVTMPSGLTKDFYNVEVVEDGEIRRQPGYITEFWTDRAIRFLEQAKARQDTDEQPFYLHLTYNGPYSLDPDLLTNPERSGNRHTERYANMPMDSFPRMEPHPGLFKHTKELNNVDAMRASAAQISGVDDGVGEVMAALERLGLTDNTLVVFTSDQGTAGGHHGIWGMGHNTKPSVAYDSVQQVPLIIRQPGQVSAGKTCDFLVNNYDLMPFVLDYVGLAETIPQNSPGRSFAGAVRGQSMEWENVTYFEHFYTRAIRTDRWKYVWRYEQPDDLFDLKTDPGELQDLAEDSSYQEVVGQMKDQLNAFFDQYADPRYDVVHGGKSKTWRPPFVEPDFVPVTNKTRYYEYDK